MKVNPIIIVDDTLCYSLVKAQKVYEKNRKKKDKEETYIKNKEIDKRKTKKKSGLQFIHIKVMLNHAILFL
jgi:hypothetical protein